MPESAAESKLDRIKNEGKAMAAKALGSVAAVGVGFAIGAFNLKSGGTLENPYLLGGKVPLDLAAAGLGLVGLLATRKATHLPLMAGAAYGALGVVGARYGVQFEPQLFGASTAPATATPTPTTQPSGTTVPGVGMLPRPMSPRLAAGPMYGTRPNPYQRQYASVSR